MLVGEDCSRLDLEDRDDVKDHRWWYNGLMMRRSPGVVQCGCLFIEAWANNRERGRRGDGVEGQYGMEFDSQQDCDQA